MGEAALRRSLMEIEKSGGPERRSRKSHHERQVSRRLKGFFRLRNARFCSGIKLTLTPLGVSQLNPFHEFADSFSGSSSLPISSSAQVPDIPKGYHVTSDVICFGYHWYEIEIGLFSATVAQRQSFRPLLLCLSSQFSSGMDVFHARGTARAYQCGRITFG